MPWIYKSPQFAAFLAAALGGALAVSTGCCCGQGWVVPPESSGFYEADGQFASQPYDSESYDYEAEDSGCCGRPGLFGHHHRPWLGARGVALAVEDEETTPVPYPKFHPVPARPVFGTPSFAGGLVPTDSLLHPPEPPFSRQPPPLPTPPGAAPSATRQRPPQLLASTRTRPSWVFPPATVKKLNSPEPTRRLAIPEPESRQAMQERMQPIRK